MQGTIINLVEQIVRAIGTEFKIYIPQVIPQVLKVFMHDNSSQKTVTDKVCIAYFFLGLGAHYINHSVQPFI